MHYVNEELKIPSVEYADDIVFFSDDKSILHNAFIKIKDYIENKLKLLVKSNYQIFPIAINRFDKSGRALDYVGFKYYRNQKLLRKYIKRNFCKKMHKLRHKSLIRKEFVQLIAPWIGWIKYSDSKNLFKVILEENRIRIE